MVRSSLVAIVGLALLGCPRGGGDDTVEPERVRIKSFSETSPVRMLVAAGDFLFSASERGLVRWSLDGGQSLMLSAEHGLPGDRVESMAHDASRNWLWLATDGGVTRYEVDNRTFVELKPPPTIIGIDSFAEVALAASVDGGLWIGHRHGLYYTNTASQWTDTSITKPVTALLTTSDGWLWIGLYDGIIARKPDGETVLFGRDQGCAVIDVRLISEAPAGGIVAVGSDDRGNERIALVDESGCAVYRSAPRDPWVAAVRRGDELLVLTRNRLYSARTSPVGARTLSRNGMRLVAVVGEDGGRRPPRSPYEIRALDMPTPQQPSALAVRGDEVFIGTDHLGTARLDYRDDRRQLSWLRRSALVLDARFLAVSCDEPTQCFMATGAPNAWRYSDGGFTAMTVPGSQPLAFVRSPGGYLFVVVRGDDQRSVEIYRKARSQWRKLRRVSIKVPGTLPQVTFAAFAPTGELWLGLQYEDEGVQQPYGAAVVNVDRREVEYHRQAFGGEKQSGWAIPLDVMDIAFLGDDEVWLASGEGAVQIRKGEVTLHNETNALNSELPRGLAMSSGGVVFVATRAGVISYNGESWKLIAKLRESMNDVAVAPDGRLWLATDRGIAVYDGVRVHRVDKRRGLLENRIHEIAIDHLGRVWARGSQGITIITP